MLRKTVYKYGIIIRPTYCKEQRNWTMPRWGTASQNTKMIVLTDCMLIKTNFKGSHQLQMWMFPSAKYMTHTKSLWRVLVVICYSPMKPVGYQLQRQDGTSCAWYRKSTLFGVQKEADELPWSASSQWHIQWRCSRLQLSCGPVHKTTSSRSHPQGHL